MTNLEMWSLIIGFFLPLVVAVLQQRKWPSALRAAITFAVCILVGLGNAYFNDQFTGRSIVSSVLLVLVAAITTYKGLWQQIGVTQRIEAATSPKSGQNLAA